MAKYTHLDVANSPGGYWGGSIGFTYTATSSLVILDNVDSTETRLVGNFTLDAQDHVTGGTITSMLRTFGADATISEQITGLSKSATAFLAKPDSEAKFAFALSGSDTLDGFSGNDYLDGFGGSDHMVGGLGDDIYIVDQAGDTVIEAADAGNDRVYTSLASLTLSANVEVLQYTGAGNFTGSGNDLGNYILGGAGNDTLFGGGGDDHLFGGNGNDKMVGGEGNDYYKVGSLLDTVTELADQGLDVVETTLSTYTLGANIEYLTYNGQDNFFGTGNELANNLYGGQGDDTLKGLAGKDSLFSSAGQDTLIGGADDDSYLIDVAGAKVIELANDGHDSISASLNTFALPANVEDLRFVGLGDFTGTGNGLDNTIEGDSGNDTLNGLAGNDTLKGDSGDDTLKGGAGDDQMFGGTGNDTYFVDSAGDKVTEFSFGPGEDTVRTSLPEYTLGAFVEELANVGAGDFAGTGNQLDNTLWGNIGNDTLSGLAGDDTMYNLAGVDTLVGGTGDDIYIVKVAGTTVTELAGEGTDEVDTALNSYALGANLESLHFTGSGNFAATGNGLDNQMVGGTGNDSLNGNFGADTLFGNGGNDSLIGEFGDDILHGGGGNDTLNGGFGADSLFGDGGSDTASYSGSIGGVVINLGANVAFGGDATGDTLFDIENLSGSFFADSLTGDDGSNFLSGNGDNDVLNGGDGNDRLMGGDGKDTLDGGAGTADLADYGDKAVSVELTLDGANDATATVGGVAEDTVRNIERITGGSAGDTLTGDGLDNALNGGDGDDVLSGNGGNDRLNGGHGLDKLTGGAGDDTFFYGALGDSGTTTATRDQITGFSSGDQIDVHLIDAIAGGADNAFVLDTDGSFSKGEIRQTVTVNDHLLVEFNTDADPAAEMSILLLDHTSLLGSADFVL